MSLFPSIKNDLIEKINNSKYSSKEIKDKFLKLISEDNLCYGKHSSTHITSSIFVLDENWENALLLNHKKYNKWLAFGGHWNDNNFSQETIFQGAVREMFEEAFNNKTIYFEVVNNSNPIDLDIHQAADHIHYDLAFAVSIDKEQEYTLSNEAKSISWINLNSIIENRNNLFNDRLVRMSEVIKSINYNEVIKSINYKKKI